MSDSSSALEIAVLINGSESPLTPLVQESFVAAIKAASFSISTPPPSIDFYDPIVTQLYPAPVYDLIILSGGTADPAGTDLWVVKLREYLRHTVQLHPKQKIVGICWGHQAICVAFGGNVGNLDGPEVGVIHIELTTEGKKMFPFTRDMQIRIHEFHRRAITAAAPGFLPLAEDNQAFLNEDNTILTFQGHPELHTSLAKTMLENVPSYMGVEEAQKVVLTENMESSHDGVAIWSRILQWTKGG